MIILATLPIPYLNLNPSSFYYYFIFSLSSRAEEKSTEMFKMPKARNRGILRVD